MNKPTSLPEPTDREEKQSWVVREAGYRVERRVNGSAVEISLHELPPPVTPPPMTPYEAGQLGRALIAAQNWPDGSWSGDSDPLVDRVLLDRLRQEDAARSGLPEPGAGPWRG